YLLSKLTRQHVTVSLSGDGGDELFSGYIRYLWARKIRRTLAATPSLLRRGAAAGIRTLSREQWDAVFGAFSPVLPRKLRVALPGDKMHKLARVLTYSRSQDVYSQMISHWDDPEQIVIGGREPPVGSFDPRMTSALPDYISRMMYLDAMTYLPDDVMVKVDRASMASSLEAREPLLDYRLFEFAWQLPLSMKMRGRESKWALRQILYKHVPRELIERPKMGFGVPIDSWLRGPLREWAGDMLSEASIRKLGVLRPEPILQKWQQHLEGKHNWQYHLWDALMLQSWLQEHLR
ncbi:MAG: asparagine synthetase B, partial [Deltaproteobacteria bacterium]|nr:asparagine synthetase B [Deltaproteobacteria bacterium]